MQTLITFPPSREHLGKLVASGEAGSGFLVETYCLGRSDNKAAEDAGNPGRDPLLRCGDVPTGTYKAYLYYKKASPVALRSYGKADDTGQIPMIALIPESGEALKAAGKPGRRTGLAIHTGDENLKYTWWKGLRPTNGCVRIPQAVMDALVARHKFEIGVGYTDSKDKPLEKTHIVTVQ